MGPQHRQQPGRDGPRRRLGRDGAGIVGLQLEAHAPRAPRLVRVLLVVCNSDAFGISERDSATNRESITILQVTTALRSPVRMTDA